WDVDRTGARGPRPLISWDPDSRSGSQGCRRHRDRLDLEVALQALPSELATDAAGLHAAERGGRVHAVRLVDPEGPGAHASGDIQAPVGVGRPHGPREAV